MEHKRQRIRTKSSVISHATPNGKMQFGEKEKLRKKFENGDITKDELKKYVNFLMLEKKVNVASTKITIKFCGKTMVLTMEEYNKYYKPAYNNV